MQLIYHVEFPTNYLLKYVSQTVRISFKKFVTFIYKNYELTTKNKGYCDMNYNTPIDVIR